MPIPNYTKGYPLDNSSLGQTKSTIRDNLDGTFETLNIDHINNNGQPGSQPAGYHTIIHQVPQTSVSTVSGYNQVFSGVPGTLVVNSVTTASIPNNGDTQLYSLTGTGVLSQLTGSSRAATGYVWVGGILLQWGIINFTAGSKAVTFAATFPNHVWSIALSGDSTTPSLNGTVSFHNLTTSGFTAYQQQGSALTAYYIAIGN